MKIEDRSDHLMECLGIKRPFDKKSSPRILQVCNTGRTGTASVGLFGRVGEGLNRRFRNSMRFSDCGADRKREPRELPGSSGSTTQAGQWIINGVIRAPFTIPDSE